MASMLSGNPDFHIGRLLSKMIVIVTQQRKPDIMLILPGKRLKSIKIRKIMFSRMWAGNLTQLVLLLHIVKLLLQIPVILKYFKWNAHVGQLINHKSVPQQIIPK